MQVGTIPASGGLRTDVIKVPAGGTSVEFGAGPETGRRAFILGWNTYTDASKKLSVRATGRGGWRVSDWVNTSTPYAPLNAIAHAAPDLSVIVLSNNDASDGVPVETYKSQMRTLITQCRISGDVLLVSQQTSNMSRATLALYNTALYELADEFDLPLMDVFNEWGTYDEAVAAGRMADTSHPNHDGMRAFARALARILRTL